MITSIQISKKLSEAIKTSGKSQSEIARQLGIHHSQISRYIKGEKLPSIETLANPSVIMDISTLSLLNSSFNRSA